MALTLREIAAAIDGFVEGDPELRVERIRSVELAGEGELAVLSDGRYHAEIDRSRATALIVPTRLVLERTDVIRVDDPRRALVRVLGLFRHTQAALPGVHPLAFVSPTATLGARVSIAPFVFVGDDVTIGDDVVIEPNVTIYAGSRIGSRVVLHAGTVIGSDGFGYVGTDAGHEKIPQLGMVVIEDDVEIGANCAIDRATLEVTRIGAGTKIDNLVQIGHNTIIGEQCILAGQAGISGSVMVGDRVMIGGQAGVADHVRLGAGVRIGAQAGAHADIASGDWLGTPALPRERMGRIFAMLPHLPEYRERVRALESRIEELEKRIEQLLAHAR